MERKLERLTWVTAEGNFIDKSQTANDGVLCRVKNDGSFGTGMYKYHTLFKLQYSDGTIETYRAGSNITHPIPSDYGFPTEGVKYIKEN